VQSQLRGRGRLRGGKRRRNGFLDSLGALDFDRRSCCPVHVLLFGRLRRSLFNSASLIAGSAGHLALFPCSSFGTSGGDKGNPWHSDPVALRHEPGQGRGAAEPNPEAFVNEILQPRPYLWNTEGNMSAWVRGDTTSRVLKRE
jgi:hypothetical protein